MLGDHGRWQKIDWQEPGVKVPLIVACPGVASGRVSDALVDLIDVHVTRLEWVGAEPPDIDARSFAPLIRGAAPSSPQRAHLHAQLLADDLRPPMEAHGFPATRPPAGGASDGFTIVATTLASRQTWRGPIRKNSRDSRNSPKNTPRRSFGPPTARSRSDPAAQPSANSGGEGGGWGGAGGAGRLPIAPGDVAIRLLGVSGKTSEGLERGVGTARRGRGRRLDPTPRRGIHPQAAEVLRAVGVPHALPRPVTASGVG